MSSLNSKYSIYMSPIEWEGRIYTEAKNAEEAYNKRLPFEGAMLIRRFGDTMWISMANSKLDWNVVKQMKKTFKNMGIKRVKWDAGKCIKTMYL